MFTDNIRYYVNLQKSKTLKKTIKTNQGEINSKVDCKCREKFLEIKAATPIHFC